MTVQTGRAPNLKVEGIAGSRHVLTIGMWSAWFIVPLYVLYLAAVVASGATSGRFIDPYWAIAEATIMVGAAIQVMLFAAIYEAAPARARLYSLIAFGWMLVMAALTFTVHFLLLFVARRMNISADPGVAAVFDFAKPSLVQAVDIAAWHAFFGLSLLFAASAFGGSGLQRIARLSLWLGGGLCLAGLIGPAIGAPRLRIIGMLGYGLVFPITSLIMGFIFRDARRLVD